MAHRDEDLRHTVQSYEIKLNKAQYAIAEEARLAEELVQKRNEFSLQKRKIEASSKLHADSIESGQALVVEFERDIKMQMTELQKDRILLDDVDVEL